MFGFFQRDGTPVSTEILAALAGLCADGSALWAKGCFAGSPRVAGLAGDGFVFLAEGRVDNREELAHALGLSAGECLSLTDGALLRMAYLRWGEECPGRVYGDWAFAAWHPRERQLFLARDHFGNTAIHYLACERGFAFASSAKSLLTLNLSPLKLDELYLAQVLTSWPNYHGERTITSPLCRLPPAHCLRVTADRLEPRCYWRLEETPLLRLPRREDYVEPFLAVFDEAVRARLRPPRGAGGSGVAAMLSGGLDSGSVAATAALWLREEGRRLPAFTSVPQYETRGYVGRRFGDEYPLAAATARLAGNIDHFPVAATQITPIAAIRRMLAITGEPGHAAGNLYWILALDESARAAGAGVLLTGQLGNAGISWTGDPFSHSWFAQIQGLGWRKWARERVKRAVPVGLLSRWHRLRRSSRDGLRGSAIHPDFARRLRLAQRRMEDPDEVFSAVPGQTRLRILKPGRSMIGALYAAKQHAGGLEYRDPTGDPRVLQFCLSVPDWVFLDPQTGLDRWLIRAAMKGRLPDEVRLNLRRGRQAGDLVPRLRACAAEVEEALAEIARGPASEYVDAAQLGKVWAAMRAGDSPGVFHDAICVLTRGIMAGLFVNQFFARWPEDHRLAPP